MLVSATRRDRAQDVSRYRKQNPRLEKIKISLQSVVRLTTIELCEVDQRSVVVFEQVVGSMTTNTKFNLHTFAAAMAGAAMSDFLEWVFPLSATHESRPAISLVVFAVGVLGVRWSKRG